MCVFFLCAQCRASKVVLNKDPNDPVSYPSFMTILAKDRTIVKYTEGIEMTLGDLIWHEQNSMFAPTANGTFLYNGFEDKTVAKLSEEYVDLLGLDRDNIVDNWDDMRKQSKKIIEEDKVEPISQEETWDQFINEYIPAKYNDLKNNKPNQVTSISDNTGFGGASGCTCSTNRCVNTVVESCIGENAPVEK